MKKSKSDAITGATPTAGASTMKEAAGARQVGQRPAISAVPNTIHSPIDGGRVVSDRAYVFINVHPGRTSDVTQLVLSRIHEIDGVSQTETHLVYRLKTSHAA